MRHLRVCCLQRESPRTVRVFCGLERVYALWCHGALTESVAAGDEIVERPQEQPSVKVVHVG